MWCSQDFCGVFLVWEVMVSSQACFLFGPSISSKRKNLLVNFPSVFGLYDVSVLVKMSFIGNSIYGVFLIVVLWGFFWLFLTASSVLRNWVWLYTKFSVIVELCLNGFCVELKTVLRLPEYKFIPLVCGVIKLVVLPFRLLFSCPLSVSLHCVWQLCLLTRSTYPTQLEICSVVPSCSGSSKSEYLIVLIRLKE